MTVETGSTALIAEIEALKQDLEAWKKVAEDACIKNGRLQDEMLRLQSGKYLQALTDAIGELKRENDELRRDAERYRWLRRGVGAHENFGHQWEFSFPTRQTLPVDRIMLAEFGSVSGHLDEAIDVAMKDSTP